MTFDIQSLLTAGATIVALFTLLISKIVSLYRMIKRLQNEAQLLIVGVYGAIPPELYKFQTYTNLWRLRRGRGKVRVLLLRNMSYGLRKCDYVVSDHDDIKVINFENHDRLKAVLDGFVEM